MSTAKLNAAKRMSFMSKMKQQLNENSQAQKESNTKSSSKQSLSFKQQKTDKLNDSCRILKPLAQGIGDIIFKRKKRRENMSKRELQNELNTLVDKKNNLKKEETAIMEKIEHINNNI